MRCVRFTPSKKPSVTAATTAIATRLSSSKNQQPSSTAVLPSNTRLLRPPKTTSNTRLSQPPTPNLKNQPDRTAVMGRSHVQPASLNSIGPKPVQSETKPGGRHPQPPDAANTKLKHKCPFDGCPWRFATPYKLRRHIKSHTKETPYLCKECGRGFSVRYNLLMHIQTIHSQPQRYKCPIRGCKEAFHSQPRLNGHVRRVHKKDLKTLNESTRSDSSTAPNSRCSSTSSTESAETKTSARNKYECSECKKECGSQSKLNAHMRTHTGEKPFKCTVQGCEKAFASKDRLTKHVETHKHSKQFCCPHENCNRIFLRQTHLKNHLKIHTQGHFVCPVVDCSQKFASEVGYNEHLNSHINYGHRCPHAGCQLSFPTRRRLELHCRALHSTPGTSESGPLLHGAHLHPVGIAALPQSHLHPAHPQPLPHHQATQHAPPPASNKRDLLNFVDKEIIENVDLPGLTVEDIETVLSEHSEWSGAQIEQFLRSAVDLSEIEAKLFSMEGYESDSGYSTYDVSPITSSAPMQLNGGPPVYHTPSLSPALTPIDSASMLSVNLSPTNPSFYPAPIPMHPESSNSPSSDISFFSPTAMFTPFSSSSTSQENFSPVQSCPLFSSFTMHHKPYPATTTATSSAINLSEVSPVSIASYTNFQSEFTDLLESTSTTTHMPSFSELSPNSRRASDRRIMCNFLSSEVPKTEPGSNQLEAKVLPSLEKLRQETDSKKPVSAQPVSTEAVSSAVKLEGETTGSCALANTSVPSDDVISSTSSNATDPAQTGEPPANSGDANPSNIQLPPNFKLPPNFQLPPNLVNLPRNNLQSLLSMCSKMPVLNNLLASSNNPAVFLVAISTALSTLTKPHQNDTNGNAASAKSGAGRSGSPIDLAQLQSLVAKLGPEQLQKLVLGPKMEPGQLPPCAGTSVASNCHPNPASSSASHLPMSSSLTPPMERTVFASVLPPQVAGLPVLPPMTRNGFNPAAIRNDGRYCSDQLGNCRSVPQVQHKYLSNCTNPMVSVTQHPKGQQQKPRLHRTSHPVAMKTQKKKPQWPRSMSKANLMAFREHILNKLKKTPDDVETTEDNIATAASKPVIKSESPLANCDSEMMYQRNHSRCHSEPADSTDCSMDSPLSLQPCHSDSRIANVSSLSELLNTSDLLSEFQFNPDTLLSPSVLPFPDEMLDGLTSMEHSCDALGSPQTPVDTSADDEIKQLLGHDSQEPMEMDCIRDLLSEVGTNSSGSPDSSVVSTTLRICAELSPSPGSNVGSPAGTPQQPARVSSPAATTSRRQSQVSDIVSQASPASRPSSAVGTPTYKFLDSLHGSVESLAAQLNGHTSIRLHIEQNLDSILQTHHDPLLAGSTCGSEPFDI